ncbi:MAG: DUF1836 domain-containing protein [Ruminococcus sp.]|nr:DUF1836 domain-containing protein [Ruminococcus sp.]
MIDKLPGTIIDFSEQAEDNAFSLIEPILTVTGGITLSQLSALTGLQGSTIQNWIKRGWVTATIDKKYTERQVSRILLINILRNSMKLEDIANLMAYINGRVDDLSDDILHDRELYNLFCRLICLLDRKGIYDPCEISVEIDRNLGAEYDGEARKRLNKVLFIMTMGYRSSYLIRQIETEFQTIKKTNKEKRL